MMPFLGEISVLVLEIFWLLKVVSGVDTICRKISSCITCSASFSWSLAVLLVSALKPAGSV